MLVHLRHFQGERVRPGSTSTAVLDQYGMIRDRAVKIRNHEVIGEWRAMFGALGIGYEVISTDAPFGVPLRRVGAQSLGAPHLT